MQRLLLIRAGSAPSRRRLLAGCAVLLVVCLGLPALAGKPGSKGSRSSATVTISLEVRPALGATHIASTQTADSRSGNSNDVLCLNLSETRSLNLVALTSTGVRTPLRTLTIRREAGTRHSATQSGPSCSAHVPFDVSNVSNPNDGPIVLLVSPE